MPSSPFYLDWQFWAAVLAAIAIVLSQLPPVHLWFKPTRLILDFHERINLSHKVGNPNLTAFTILRNAGGRRIRVLGMTAEISREGVCIASAPLQNYWENAQAQAPTLFLPIELAPGESWSSATNFFPTFDRRTEKEYRSLESALKANIQNKLTAGIVPPFNQMMPGDDALVTPFFAMFRKFFIWEPGEYQVKLVVETDHRKYTLEQIFRFVLFESDSQEFHEHVDQFKYGEGLWFTPPPSAKQLFINVPIVR